MLNEKGIAGDHQPAEAEAEAEVEAAAERSTLATVGPGCRVGVELPGGCCR